jgi:parallel beta-helix repeat protein
MKQFGAILVCILLYNGPGLSQEILINEYLASNVTDYPEMYDFDDYTDWIELYNSDVVPYSLDGFFITDDLEDPLKWKIPNGTVINAEGYLIIWADDYNESPGQVYTRPYWPWDDFTTQHYHTNFKISANGEQLGLARADQTGSYTLIEEGSLWKYLDDGSDQELAWTQIDFDDSSWSTGNAELGYGDGDEETVVSYGPDEDNKYITTYFRHTFNINNPDDIQTLTIRLKRDDGAIIFLNGNEVLRSNMPAGTIAYDTYASSAVGGSDEDTFFEWTISANEITDGQNVFAVEIHQVSESSSDISFDLELTGTGYSNTELVDSITFGSQITDVSRGRSMEDNAWYYFGEPTPGAPNNTMATNSTNVSGPVQASLEAGFYDGSQTIELAVGSDTEQIYYTIDGSRPGTGINIYTGPITIESTTVLKARAIDTNKLPGEIMTTTYFIDEQNFVPTVSLVAEPETLWDEDIGIYENEYKQREIPVTIEYFTPDAEHGFTVNAGTRLGGLNIWTKPQKPFTIYTRDRFGQDFIHYQLFENKQIANFSRIVFRNGGDDWEETLIRDPMTESLAMGMMDCGYMAYTPSALYLNGAYWGIHNVREKFDPLYFSENFNVDPNNIDQLEYTQTQSGTQLMVIEGSMDHYNSMINYILSNDLNEPAVYAQIKELMNVDSFIDHVVMTLYCANTSWGHNREWWRSREESGKWQWLIVDLDRGFNVSNSYTNLLDNLMDDYELFQYLLNSQFFQDRFIQRAAAHLSNTFLPERINTIVDSLSNIISAEMPRHIDRWGDEGGISSMNAWANDLDDIKQFAQNRNTLLHSQFISELNLDGTVQVAVAINPPGAGKVSINDVPMIHPDGEGVYFKNKSLSLLAQPQPGYQFLGWDGVSDSMRIDYNCLNDTTFIAVFQISDEEILPEVITENTLLTNEQPYAVIQDLTVAGGATLTMSDGVEIRMPDNGNIIIEGQLVIEGTQESPAQIIPNSSSGSTRWGGICFNNDTDTSTVSYLYISGASTGIDPMLHKGAISSINSHIVLNHIEIENVEFPVYVEGGSIIINSSSIACDFTCDYINVKGGDALIENSIFYGSDALDTDAIDLDNVTGGVIRNNRIYNFTGFNSDGIDIGENSEDILISSNLIYHTGDKGISVGQGSTVTLDRNLVVGSNHGIAIKDNSAAYVINNTFFYNDTAVSCYEKNEGAGGGTAEIVNTILSNNLSSSVYADELSVISVSYTLSDSELLDGEGNLFSDPLFIDQSIYNLELDLGSPCVDAGDPDSQPDEDGSSADMGAYYIYDPDDYPFDIPDQLIGQLKINEILVNNDTTNTDESGEYDDWIEIYNTSGEDIDLSGMYLTDNADNLTKWQFPFGGVMLEAGSYLLVWCDENQEQGPLHTNFKLSSEGEFIALTAEDGVTITDSITFGQQSADVSFGRMPDGSDQWMFLDEPSPGAPNSTDDFISIEVENIPGWNLVGLPLEVENASYSNLFPESIEGTLYSFDNTYIPDSILILGYGYWLKFNNAGSTALIGIPINELTISLSEGWNLISGISISVDINIIIDVNDLIVSGTIYGFDGTYVNAEMIDPGIGYWLRSYEDGEITISSNSTLSAKTTRETITLLEHANTLTLANQTLYFGVEIPEDEKLSYSLPPKPPAGAFDVRFSGNWKFCGDSGVLEIMNPTETLEIQYDIQNKEQWEIIPVIVNGTKWSAAIPLSDQGQLTLDSEVNQWILRKSTSTVPTTFTLHPAYPNPFNPITTLRYNLPEDTQVTLTVYDLMGREVTQLVNTTQEPGFKSVQWDATDSFGKPVSAGVYLYQVRAGSFVQTKKIVLLK